MTAKKKPAAKAKTKTAAKAKAKPKPKPKAKPKPASPGELARAGKVDALADLMDLDSSSKNDRDAYKWLTAAHDLGHAKAAPLIDDVMEVSSMRYDDDQYEVAAAHWELAAAYLEGADDLPLDLALAKQNLAEAFRIHDLDGINAGTGEKYTAKKLLARLRGEAKELLESALAGDVIPEDDDDE